MPEKRFEMPQNLVQLNSMHSEHALLNALEKFILNNMAYCKVVPRYLRSDRLPRTKFGKGCYNLYF